jgi:hypothetical protein
MAVRREFIRIVSFPDRDGAIMMNVKFRSRATPS